MKITNEKYYNLNKSMFINRHEYGEIEKVLNNEDKIISYQPPVLKKDLISKFVLESWLTRKKIMKDSSRSVQLFKNGIGLQIQFGHFAMAYYDVLKFSTLFHNKKLDIAVFICLEQELSQRLTSNIVGYEKFIFEYNFYSEFLELPLVVLELGESN